MMYYDHRRLDNETRIIPKSLKYFDKKNEDLIENTIMQGFRFGKPLIHNHKMHRTVRNS